MRNENQKTREDSREARGRIYAPLRIIIADKHPPVSGGGGAAAAVVVNASHGGVYAAYLAAKLQAAAAIFNDAGVGRDRAGLAGLDYLQQFGIAAATVGHDTARIGDGADMNAHGVITHANALAASLGVSPGLSCRGRSAHRAVPALRRLAAAPPPPPGSAGSGIPAHRRSATSLGTSISEVLAASTSLITGLASA